MRAAVIGVGAMGLRHVEILTGLGHQLVGCCDERPEALEAASKRFDIPGKALFRSAEELLSLEIELLVVATTAPSHPELTIAAADAGVPYVLCEKPMARSIDLCSQMIEACSGRTQLAINHQMRFMPQYTRVRDLFDSGRFGSLRSMNVVAGNCGLAMNGSHYVEAFRFLSGSRITSVRAWFSSTDIRNPRGRTFRDAAGRFHAETEAGSRLALEISDDQGHGLTVVYAGDTGQILVDELSGHVWCNERRTEFRLEPTSRYALPFDADSDAIPQTETIESSAALLSALIRGGDVPTGVDGRAVVAALVAGYLSHEMGGRSVDVDTLPTSRTFPWA